MVASARGMMVMAAVMSMEVSRLSRAKRPKTVLLHWKGRPSQAASFTAVKSTLPVTAATRYEATTPRRMGIILIMPLPKMLVTTTTRMATRAIHQLLWQLSMAEELRVRPMQMMTGPVTMGGKKRMTFLMPKTLKSADKTT